MPNRLFYTVKLHSEKIISNKLNINMTFEELLKHGIPTCPVHEEIKYFSSTNTFDKYEAKDHEYWRSQELANLRFIKDLEELLEEIDAMCLEEVEIEAEAEADYRQNIAEAQI